MTFTSDVKVIAPSLPERINRRRFITQSVVTVGTLAGTEALLSACGGNSNNGTNASVQLKQLTWTRAYDGPAMDAVYEKFHNAHPSISVLFENDPTNYATTLKTRLANNDGPDIFGLNVSRADIQAMLTAGHLSDLSNQTWTNNMTDIAKMGATIDGKVVGLVFYQYIMSVMYSKKIYRDLNLAVPKTYDEFVKNCTKIKAAGLYPISQGLKDAWTATYLPWNMAMTAIYRDHPTFDEDLVAGKVTFANSAWLNIFTDILNLFKAGYYNPNPLGTTYDQALQLMVAGKGAMVINGSWFLPDIRKTAPDIELGLFPLPYKEGSQLLCSSPGDIFTLDSKGKHVEAAKTYLAYWGSLEGASTYLQMRGLLPALKSVNTKVDPALEDAMPYIQSGAQHLPPGAKGYGWPAEVQDAMANGVQAMFAGTATPAQVVKNMDTALATAKSK